MRLAGETGKSLPPVWKRRRRRPSRLSKKESRGDGITITAAVFPQNEKNRSRMLRVGKGYKRLSSRSSDLRISSVARLLGVTQWLAFACATPTRLQRRHRSGFSPDSLFSPLSYCGRRSTRHDSVVIDIIRTGGAFVNGVLPDRKKKKASGKTESFLWQREKDSALGLRRGCAFI